MTVPAVLAQQPIETVEQLRAHLHQAAQLEMSTIPLYLYAAYSIKTRGYSQWSTGTSAVRAIKSVVIEEMLHLCLARNLLVAVGGGEAIAFYDKEFLPEYPEPMLHRAPELKLHLEPCTTKLMLDVFMPFELPATSEAPPQPDSYSTIGAFYGAIVEGFERLSGPELWKQAHPELQYHRAYWNQDGGGRPLVVHDLVTALEAIKTIVEQGEGAAPGDEDVPTNPVNPQPGADELSHYAKFRRIAEGIDAIGEVWPVPTDPCVEDYEGPVRALATLFNACYCYLMCMLDVLYATPSEPLEKRPSEPLETGPSEPLETGPSEPLETGPSEPLETGPSEPLETGVPNQRYGLERTCIAAMGGVLFPLADLLVSQPTGTEGQHAAPTFEFYSFSDTQPRKDQLTALCTDLLDAYPSLGGDNGVHRLIGLLPSV
jgi:hypothetical protein